MQVEHEPTQQLVTMINTAVLLQVSDTPQRAEDIRHSIRFLLQSGLIWNARSCMCRSRITGFWPKAVYNGVADHCPLRDIDKREV